MQTILKISLALVLMLLGSSLQAQSKEQTEKLKTAIITLVEKWTPGEHYENEHGDTWIPEFGIRGKYHVNKQNMSIKMLGLLVGEPVYTKGQKEEGMEFKDEESFGYYNSAFLKKSGKMLKNILKDKAFLEKTQDFYDQNLREYICAFWDAYNYVIKEDKKRTAERVEKVKTGELKEYQELFREWSDRKEDEGRTWYEMNTCCGFWLRRSVDGTVKDFYKLMALMMKTYDPEYFRL